MFDLLASAISAFNQVGVFIGALVCWGFGGLLVGNAVYWRVHALRVQGQVIGVRRDGNCFNSVYRYDSPTGETFEATSREGSNSLRGRETGRVVPLWVIPEKPLEVQEAGDYAMTVIGVVLLGFGVGLFWFAATTWRVGPMTWLMAALFVANLLRKALSTLAPRDKTLPRSGWGALRALVQAARTGGLIKADSAAAAGGANAAGGAGGARGATSAASPIQRVEDLTSTPEFRQRETDQRRQLGRWAPFLTLAGVALLALGVYQSRALLRLESTGARTAGVVTALSSSRSGDGVTYYPLVRYSDGAGRRAVFRDSTGTNPPLYRVGDAVTVLYLPGQPDSAVIDRGLWNWLPSAILYLIGGALLASGLAAWRSRAAAAAPLFSAR